LTETASIYADYLIDLTRLVKDLALSAKKQKSSAAGDDLQFASGRLLGLHEVISLMQEQAVAFGIPATDIGLGDIDPERDLT
jgi:hypothetical protein